MIYLAYGGGAGGGKSFATMGAILTLLVAFPGNKGVVFRDTYPNLENTRIESWKKLIHDEICANNFIQKYNQLPSAQALISLQRPLESSWSTVTRKISQVSFCSEKLPTGK